MARESDIVKGGRFPGCGRTAGERASMTEAKASSAETEAASKKSFGAISALDARISSWKYR